MISYDPVIVSQAFNPPHVAVELIVSEDLFFLQGHFPGRPVLPGVVQVHWAILLAESSLSLNPIFLGLEALKFHRIIKPGARLELALEHVESSGRLKFSYTSELGLHSQGRALFGKAS